MARDLEPVDLNVVRTGIGAELRRLYADVLSEEIPDRTAELIKQLDEQRKLALTVRTPATHSVR